MASGDNPSIRELESLMKFINNHKHIYIYGAEHNSVMLGKYLDMCGNNLYEGYVVSDDKINDAKIDVYALSEIKNLHADIQQIGFLLVISDRWIDDVLHSIGNLGFEISNVYVFSEYNKRNIAHKMTPRPRERMWIEVNLVDHCNLNCQMCDHFAPLAQPTYLDIETYTRDIKRLAELAGGHIDIMKLQGGEPLLNNQLIEFIKITRKYLPAALVFLFTDGLLLKRWENAEQGNLWQACHDYNIWIEMTVYPIGIKLDEIKNLADKYDVHLRCFSEVGNRNYTGVKHSKKHPFRLQKDVAPWQFIGCYQFNESITLKDGKLYTCPMIPYIDHFNRYFNQNMVVTENDYLDIFEAKSYDELAEFVTHRTDFCSYCDIKNRRSFEWKQSSHTIEEYVDIGDE